MGIELARNAHHIQNLQWRNKASQQEPPVNVITAGNRAEVIAGNTVNEFGVSYLLVLVGRDRGEHRFREGEGLHAVAARHGLNGRELVTALFTDDVDTRLVLVHGV